MISFANNNINLLNKFCSKIKTQLKNMHSKIFKRYSLFFFKETYAIIQIAFI